MFKIKTLIVLLRPHQWLKNLMLFFPPFLGGVLLSEGVALKGVIPFVAFAFASSAGYIINDLMDSEADRNHPVKCGRPLASGKVSVAAAVWLIVLLIIAALRLAFFIKFSFAFILTSYLLISVTYSCCLKKMPVVDLFCIATGFIFRLMAGGIVFNVQISEWLFLSVLLLSLFLSAGKRLSEKNTLCSSAEAHRKVLAHYPDGFLDGVLYMTGSAVLVTYTMYTVTHSSLIYSVPICFFGLMRYIYRVKAGQGGDPTDALLKDYQLMFVGLLWVIIVGWGIYNVTPCN